MPLEIARSGRNRAIWLQWRFWVAIARMKGLTEFESKMMDVQSRRLRYEGKAWLLTAGIIAGMMLLVSCSRKVTATPAPESVPVVVARVERQNVPIQIRVIGNVQPYSTVTVRSQVTGELTGVFFRDGQDVKKGDLLFKIDQRSFEAALHQAEATLASDQAQEQNAATQVKRYADLLQEGIIPKEQNDQMMANQQALAATVRADEAAVENAKVQLQYCSIYSPADGRTGNLLVNAGNVVTANSSQLVVINQIRPVYVSFAVPEASLADVRRYASSGELKVQAMIPEEPAAEGTLTFIDNAVDPATGTIRLRGTFPNSDNRLWPGQFVDVVLTLTTKPNAIVVPSAAIQTGQQGPFVFLVKEDKTADVRPVTVGLSTNGESVISQGLEPGEMVVTDGQSRLTQGTRVEIRTGSEQGARK